MDDNDNDNNSRYLSVAKILKDQKTFYKISEYQLDILESNPHMIDKFASEIHKNKL